MRLIDADKVREHKYKGVQYEKAIVNELPDDPPFAFMCGWNDALDSVYQYAPTVDAEPVRHGHWIDEIGMFLCSECGDAWGTDNEEMVRSFNYCPNCGAKMDEVEDG